MNKIKGRIEIWSPSSNKKGEAVKLKLRHRGPYSVLEKKSDNEYLVQHLTKKRNQPVKDPVTKKPIVDPIK